MTSDLDIYRTANLMIKRHGSQAQIQAAQRADKLDTSKNLDGDPKKRLRVGMFQNRMANKPESNVLIQRTQHSGRRFLEVSSCWMMGIWRGPQPGGR